jgi:hypothetical protein
LVMQITSWMCMNMKFCDLVNRIHMKLYEVREQIKK